MTTDHHPVWPLLEKLAGYCMIMGVLVFLTNLNATNFDWALKGEAGTIGGTGIAGLIWVIYQWYTHDLEKRESLDELEERLGRLEEWELSRKQHDE